MRTTLSRIIACALTSAIPALCADWNPRLAADYLDSRQKEWFAYPIAKGAGGPCVSCHTGVTYLLARPALSRILGETSRTEYETGLLDGLRTRVAQKEGSLFPIFPKEPLSVQALGTESIVSTLFLTLEGKPGGPLSPAATQAFDRLWALQIKDGDAKGSWTWFSVKLEPFETPDSSYYGATLAAVATGLAPASYRKQPEVAPRIADLTSYLERGHAKQPLHNRLMALWASTELRNVLPDATRKALIDEVWRKQRADGGWALEDFGPWQKELFGAPEPASNSYATALATFILQRSGVKKSHPNLVKSRAWLAARQDPESGSWAAQSMNKHFDAKAMPAKFMRDTATGFAVLALAEGEARK